MTKIQEQFNVHSAGSIQNSVVGGSSTKNNTQESGINTGIYSDYFRIGSWLYFQPTRFPGFYFLNLIFQPSHPF